MRTLSIFFIAVLVTVSVRAQVPGGNFENWNTLIFEYPQYAGWTIYHEGLSPDRAGLLEKSSEASDGARAIKFNTFGNNYFGYVVYGQVGEGGPSGGIPFADDPTHVTISYKCNMAAGDSAEIWVSLYSGGSIITEDRFRVGGVHPAYSDVIFNLSPYTETPDSMMFAIVPGDPMSDEPMTDGNEVYFDNVRFNGTNNLQLPDNSFENWTVMTLDYTAEMYNLEALCERSDDAYNGNYALKMTTQNVEWNEENDEIYKDSHLTLWGNLTYINVAENEWEKRITGGLPVHARKDTLVFYYKYIPSAGVADTAQASLRFVKDGLERISFYYTLFESDIYTKLELPYDLDDNWDHIPIEADFMILELESSGWRENWSAADVNIEGSSLYIDYMYFKSQEASLGIRDNNYNTGSISFYPNPTTGDLYITGVKNACTLQLISVTGAVVIQKQVSGDTKIDMADMPGGTYLVKINNRVQGRVVKE